MPLTTTRPGRALVAPSILSADFSKLGAVTQMLNDSAADWIHCDVMDGRFVPNFTFGLPVIQALKQHAALPLDVHLMMAEPERWVAQFAAAGAYRLTVHAEAVRHLDSCLRHIQAEGMQAGVALNPATPVNFVEHVLELVDLVLIMSVNPGFGGQAFIPNTYTKIRQLRSLAEERGLAPYVEVDGGVSTENAGALVQAGADVLVAGSFVFKADQPPQAIQALVDSSQTPAQRAV
jgi:ribulose-phosphate 3-epimerase